MGMVLMPVRRSDETRSNTAMRAYGAVYKGAGINIMNLQLALIIAVMAFQRTGGTKDLGKTTAELLAKMEKRMREEEAAKVEKEKTQQ
jgi:hypothetical protein